MYKGAARSARGGLGYCIPVRKIGPYKPGSRAEIRRWWFPVIEHHASSPHLKKSFHRKYDSKLPKWFALELERFGPEKWLAYWDRATGVPKKYVPIPMSWKKRRKNSK